MELELIENNNKLSTEETGMNLGITHSDFYFAGIDPKDSKSIEKKFIGFIPHITSIILEKYVYDETDVKMNVELSDQYFDLDAIYLYFSLDIMYNKRLHSRLIDVIKIQFFQESFKRKVLY